MSFIHPAFLAALAAVAIPLAIHFLRSRKLDPLDLGTLRFVREALAEVTRWEQLRDWLLLALRMTVVGLAAFLFARPFFEQDAAFDQGPGSELICVLDVSASMRFAPPGTAEPGTVPENVAAKAFAARLAAAPAHVRTVPLALADTVETLTDASAAEPLVGGPCDVAALGRWLADHVATSPTTPRRVVLFTDLQEPVGVPAEPAWPEGIPFEIVSVVPPSIRNLAAGEVRDRVRPLPAPVGDREAPSEGGDETGVESIPVPIVSVGDVVPQGFKAAAGPGDDPSLLPDREYPAGAQEIEMAMKPTQPGDIDAIVRLRPTDPWPMDDQRGYVVRFVGRQPVLLVDGDPGDADARGTSGESTGPVGASGGWEPPTGSPFASETYFLRHALATPDRGQHVSPFDVVVTRSLASDVGDRPWKVVALCNVATIDDEALRTLTSLVEAGTGLLIFPGNRLDATAWSRIHDAGLCPATIAPGVAPPVPRPLADWDRSHQALAPFAARLDGDLSRIVLRDAFDVIPDDDAVVVASMAGKRPALVSKQHGEGRVVLFVNPIDRDWTDLPSERLYLPFVRSLFRYATRIGSDPAEGLPPDRPLRLADRRLPGRYPDAVVHVPVEESTLPFLDEDSFRTRLGLASPPDGIGDDSRRTSAGAARPEEWWPWLAIALLSLVIIEPFIADHRRSAHARRIRGDSR